MQTSKIISHISAREQLISDMVNRLKEENVSEFERMMFEEHLRLFNDEELDSAANTFWNARV